MGGRTAAQWQRVADAGVRDTLAVGSPLVAVLARAAPVTQLLSGWSLLAGCAAAAARGVSPLTLSLHLAGGHAPLPAGGRGRVSRGRHSRAAARLWRPAPLLRGLW